MAGVLTGDPRRVLLLGGPDDGRVLDVGPGVYAVESIGVRDGDDWRKPREGDTTGAPVRYVLRRVAETPPPTCYILTAGTEWWGEFIGPAGEDICPEHSVPVLDPAKQRAYVEVLGWRATGTVVDHACEAELRVTRQAGEVQPPAWRVVTYPGGEADPADVLVAIADALDEAIPPGPRHLDPRTRAGSVAAEAQRISRELSERFVLYPREQPC